MRYLTQFLLIVIISQILFSFIYAEEGFLLLHVTDVRGKPVAGVVITATGDSSQSQSDAAGKLRIQLATQTRPGDELSLSIVSSPKGRSLVFVSPWNARVRVPPFDNKSQNVVEIVLVEAGDRAALENEQVLVAVVSRINAANATRKVEGISIEEQRRANLAEIAGIYGLQPEEVDLAIRTWSRKVSDPYEKGLAALYEKNYPLAAEQLTRSLSIREQELKRVQADIESKKRDVVDAARFLGYALYEQGKYQLAEEAYRKAIAQRPEDIVLLTNLGSVLAKIGRDAEAEAYYKQAILIGETHSVVDRGDLARSINNLATLYTAQAKYGEAEPLYEKALSILKNTQGVGRLEVAIGLNNLAVLYREQGKYDKAEPLIKEALGIWEKDLGADSPSVASGLANLAGLYYRQGKLSEAESLNKRALGIREKVDGPNHSDVANSLSDLAVIYASQGRYAEAEPLFKRSLEIREKVLPPEHPDVAASLANLGGMYQEIGRYNEAEILLDRALIISQKIYSEYHPTIAANLDNLAGIYRVRGKYSEAETLYKQLVRKFVENN